MEYTKESEAIAGESRQVLEEPRDTGEMGRVTTDGT